MIIPEQKDQCIKLYQEGSHTIKEIIEQTGLKYAPEVYQILDEAGIPRKRKYPSRKQSAPQEIDIESSRMKYLFGMCRVYDNEPENPYNEKEEPFKRYMWRNEWKILQNAKEEKFIRQYDLNNPTKWHDFFYNGIKAYIRLWTNPEKGETPRQWRWKYLAFKK